MSSSFTCPSDLIFTVLGGQRHGKQLPINATKCVLAFDDRNRQSRQPLRCAILRRQSGVVIRTLDPGILINDAPKEVHWLQTGDVIRFPNAITLQVTQLGSIEPENVNEPPFEHPADEPETLSADPGDLPMTAENDDAERTNEAAHELDSVPAVFADRPDESSPLAHDDRTSLSNQMTYAGGVGDRFGEIEKRLDRLSEQIALLVTLAGSGKFTASKLEDHEWQSHLEPTSPEPSQDTDSISDGRDADVEVDDIDDDQRPTPMPSWATELEPDSSPGLTAEQSVQPWNEQATIGEPEVQTGIGTIETPADITEHQQGYRSNDAPSAPEISQLESRIQVPETQSIDSYLTPIRRPFEIENLSDVSVEGPTTRPTIPTEPETPIAQVLASKFSTLGDITEDVPPTSTTVESSALTKTASDSSVDESLDALLKRLYEGSLAESSEHSSDPPAALNAPTEPTPFSKSATVFDQAKSTAPNSTSFDSSSYASAQFGYQIDSHASFTAGTEPIRNPFNAAKELDALVPQCDVAPSPTSHAAQLQPTSDSVLDLLARLKAEEGWQETNDSEFDQTFDNQLSNADSSNECESTSTEISSGLFVEPEPVEATAPESPYPYQNSPGPRQNHENDSVEDYMSQLLARMQTPGSPPLPGLKNKPIATANVTATTSTQPQIDEDSDDAAGLMTAEEYKPKQRAQKFDSFDTMREIANSTARSAVAVSDLNRRKTRVLMQFLIGFGAIIMAFYYLLVVSSTRGDTAMFLGCICFGIGIGAFCFAFRSYQLIKKISHDIPEIDDGAPEEPKELSGH